MTTAISTRNQTREQWLEERKTYLGGSDAASVAHTGRYGCQRKLFFDKRGVPKDIDDSDRAEFRRGHRLEHVAAKYYEEVTGRKVRYTVRSVVPGKPYLSVSMDRLVVDPKRETPGYLEIKTLGRWSMQKVKKEGPIDDYILQTQWGMAVMGYSWGAFAFYCPETDELLYWDFEADAALGEALLEKGEDFWNMNLALGIEPDPHPEGTPACDGCPWVITCRGSVPAPASAGVVDRPDLEALAAKFSELKGMGSEVEQAEKELREEFLEAVKKQPGLYKCGKYEWPLTATTSKRFQGELLKKSQPDLYEKFRVETTTLTVKRPKEL